MGHGFLIMIPSNVIQDIVYLKNYRLRDKNTTGTEKLVTLENEKIHILFSLSNPGNIQLTHRGRNL